MSARVLIIGAGGLGCPAALYLAAAGVGVITLADPDVISLSNLQRQILYTDDGVGSQKATVASERLSALNPHVKFAPLCIAVDESNAFALANSHDLVVDGTDSFAARFTINAACHAARRPLVSGAVGRWTGQVGLFESGPSRDLPRDQRKPCYRCLVRRPPADAEACERVGVLGALVGVIGAIMAVEVIKHLTGAGKTLSGRLLLYDGLDETTRTMILQRDPDCPVCADAEESTDHG